MFIDVVRSDSKKMPIPLKFICKFNTLLNKIPTGLFMKLGKMIPKYI